MISFFTVPKPFTGHTGIIQRNAIESWSRAAAGVEVILFGDESGTAEAAAATGALHVPRLLRSPYGAPLLDDVFREAARLAAHDTLCFVNSDILFRGDLSSAIVSAATVAPFLVIGESTDMDVPTSIPFDRPDWRSTLSGEEKRRGPLALDYFVFSRGVFTEVPPFAMGRARFDNWLVWQAIDRGLSVVDATRAVGAIHQSHDYGHLPGGRREAYRGADARRNQSLAGLWCYLHLYSVLDARFELSADGIRRRDWRFSFLRQIWCRLSGLVASRGAGNRRRRRSAE